jgi:hypothetical protein
MCIFVFMLYGVIKCFFFHKHVCVFVFLLYLAHRVQKCGVTKFIDTLTVCREKHVCFCVSATWSCQVLFLSQACVFLCFCYS